MTATEHTPGVTTGRRNAEALAVAALAVATSARSMMNGFALDDVPIIQKNAAIHSLSSVPQLLTQTYWPAEYGPSLYRPLTSIAFAIQWAAGGGSPLVFHAVSIALYVAISLLVLRLARQVAGDRAALGAAAIFAVHPVHVEAFANVVGQAELWTALLMLLALSHFISGYKTRTIHAREIVVISGLFGMALMFKEHAIVLPGMLVAAALILPSGEPARSRIARMLPLLALMTAVAVVFLVARTSVIGRFAGGSTATVLIDQGFQPRLLTMLNVVPEWIRLFLWPATLSADYSPPRIETATSFDVAMIPGILVMIGFMLIGVRARRTNPGLAIAAAVTWLALLIPSNLIIVTGFVLAERALFLPSVGVAIALGVGIAAIMEAARNAALRRAIVAGVAALMIAAVIRSSGRNGAWKDNESLFRQTVEDVPNSYRAHLMLGELLWEKGARAEALSELALAVKLSRRQDYYVRWLAADRFHAAGQLGVATRFYTEALALKPSDPKVRYGAAMALVALGQGSHARAVAAEGMQRDPSDARFRRIVHVIDSVGALHPGG